MECREESKRKANDCQHMNNDYCDFFMKPVSEKKKNTYCQRCKAFFPPLNTQDEEEKDYI